MVWLINIEDAEALDLHEPTAKCGQCRVFLAKGSKRYHEYRFNDRVQLRGYISRSSPGCERGGIRIFLSDRLLQACVSVCRMMGLTFFLYATSFWGLVYVKEITCLSGPGRNSDACHGLLRGLGADIGMILYLVTVEVAPGVSSSRGRLGESVGDCQTLTDLPS